MSIDALTNAANRGDAGACLQLAMAWMTGEGVPQQDTNKGRHWLAQAADAGNRDAMRFLGLIFLRGMDVVPDYAKAIENLGSAASEGDFEAGWILASFLGGSRDDWFDAEQAVHWLQLSAQGGFARAQCHLGYCYLTGTLIDPDELSAIKWFTKAAIGGDAGAMLMIAECYEHGYLLPQCLEKACSLAVRASRQSWSIADEYAETLGRRLTGKRTELAGEFLSESEISTQHTGKFPESKPEAFSWKPRVILMRNFLSTFECAEIANAVQQHLMPSFIVDGEGGLSKNQVRTSYEVRLRPGLRNIVIQNIEQRMATWSHHPIEHGEFPLVLHYEKSQSFEQHYDYFIPEKFKMGEGPLEWGGQRVATQLVYLNETFEGGETRFDLTDLEVKPERGMCMLFYNVSPDGNVDPLTRHTGVGITQGTKWLLSRWIREIPFDQAARDFKRDKYQA